MSVANPETMSEWKEYISILDEDEITNKAKAANSKRFFDTLMEEGFSLDDIDQIMKAFAKRFLDLNIQPPAGMVDMVNMTTLDDVQNMKLPDPEKVDWEPEPDEVDQEIEELDLETNWEVTEPLTTTVF